MCSDAQKKVDEVKAGEADPMMVEGANSVEQETEGVDVPLTTDPDDVEGVVEVRDIKLED